MKSTASEACKKSLIGWLCLDSNCNTAEYLRSPNCKLCRTTVFDDGIASSCTAADVFDSIFLWLPWKQSKWFQWKSECCVGVLSTLHLYVSQKHTFKKFNESHNWTSHCATACIGCSACVFNQANSHTLNIYFSFLFVFFDFSLASNIQCETLWWLMQMTLHMMMHLK